MRFDKYIGLIILETIDDGLGGRIEVEKVIYERYANIDELGLESTIRIYGDALNDNIKVTILGGIKEKICKIKYDNKVYKVTSQGRLRNKTNFLAEVEND